MNLVHYRSFGNLYHTFKTTKRNYTDEPPKLLNSSKYRSSDTVIDPVRFQNIYGVPYPSALSRYALTNKSRANSCYDSVAEGPIRICVKKPRKSHDSDGKSLQIREKYCMACQIPWELGHKYPIHKPDPSVRFSTENIRPTILEVMIPVANPSDNKKLTRLPPTIMREYPGQRNDNNHK